jgi:hypothetical protein
MVGDHDGTNCCAACREPFLNIDFGMRGAHPEIDNGKEPPRGP